MRLQAGSSNPSLSTSCQRLAESASTPASPDQIPHSLRRYRVGRLAVFCFAVANSRHPELPESSPKWLKPASVTHLGIARLGQEVYRAFPASLRMSFQTERNSRLRSPDSDSYKPRESPR